MIAILAFLYLLFAFAYFYTNKSGYSLLRYMYKRKNINVYLSVEIIFLILTSFIVFTNQPLNWIVAILMFMHLFGIAWLVTNPKNFYEMVEESVKLDENLVENTVAGSLFISAILVLFSRIFF
jgi:sensor histidine kinase YesM